MIKNSCVIFLLFVIVSSCVSKKIITRFQNDIINQADVSNNYTTIFKPDDLLLITIISEDLNSVRPFNMPIVTYETTTQAPNGVPVLQMYLVDYKGEIDFPVLGKIKVGGMTRDEVITLFKNKLDPFYVKNPIVNIRITNFKISVIGDVKNPGTYTIPNERITILEAIGLAGDINISAQRFNVKVFREEGNKKKELIVDLLSKNLFTSTAYYLQQNDVVYVEPNNASSQSASYNQNTGLFVSIGSILISLIAVLTR